MKYSFPAVIGVQAGRPYYMATVPFSTLKNMFKLDIGDGSALSRSQREVNENRAKKFAKYLSDNPETFVVPALTGVIDAPDGAEIKFVESEVSNLIGTLEVSMDASFLFLDGQHRSTGIVYGIENLNVSSASSVPVMFFRDLPLEGRQMAFSDINSNVSKPAQALSDTYNHRDVLSTFVRELCGSQTQLKDLVDFERNVVSAKSEYLFSIKTIKEVVQTLLGAKSLIALSQDQRDLVDKFFRDWFKGIAFETKFNSIGYKPTTFRENWVLTMGVILKAAAMAASVAGPERWNFDALSKIDWSRSSSQLANRCINPELRTMKSDATATKLTANLMLMTMEVPLTGDLGALERQVFGDYTAPEPEVKVEPTITYSYRVNKKSPKVVNKDKPYVDYINALTPEIDASPEMLEEADEKFKKVVAEFVEEFSEYHNTKEKDLANVLDSVVVDIINKKDLKIMLNLRSMRAAMRDALALRTIVKTED